MAIDTVNKSRASMGLASWFVILPLSDSVINVLDSPHLLGLYRVPFPGALFVDITLPWVREEKSNQAPLNVQLSKSTQSGLNTQVVKSSQSGLDTQKVKSTSNGWVREPKSKNT